MKKIPRIRNQRGVAAIEFAIVLPVLILLLFGTVEFGLLLYNQQVITNASREGARFGIVAGVPRKDVAEIRTVVKNYCSGHLISFGGDKTLADDDVDVTGAGGSFQENLIVTVTYSYSFLVLSNLGFGPMNLQAQTVMKME